jgi:transmembrane sensor
MSAEKQPLQSHIAEAAAWVAHLHGTRRTADSDRGLQLWLKDDAARALALEAANEVWDEVGSLQGAVIARSLQSIPQKEKPRQSTRWAIAAALLLAALSALWTTRDPGIVSGIGEQRTLVLEDGSRVLLNTASKLIVRYSAKAREVELETGEARFYVAKSPGRPFVVMAGSREIKALGTSFLVRRDDRSTAITLIEGKVSIGAEILRPGQRLTFASGKTAKIDVPALEKVTAWERGEVVMDGMHLRDAIAEMNRYTENALVVPDPRVADLLISGVFHSGDSMSFANAVANTYRLRVTAGKREIRIEGDPQTAY